MKVVKKVSTLLLILAILLPIIQLLIGNIKIPPSKNKIKKMLYTNEIYITKLIEFLNSIEAETVFLDYNACTNGDSEADCMKLEPNGTYSVASSKTIAKDSDIGKALERMYSIGFEIVKENRIIIINTFREKYLFLNYASGMTLRNSKLSFKYAKNQISDSVDDQWDFVQEISLAKVYSTEILRFFFGIGSFYYENPTISLPVVNEAE